MPSETTTGPSGPTNGPETTKDTAEKPQMSDADLAESPDYSTSASASPFEQSECTLYITDLDPLMTEAHLFKLFTEFGPIKSIRVVKNSFTRRSLGYAFVRYNNPDDAQRALQDPGPKFIDGRAIRVLPFQPDPTQRKHNHEGNIFIKNLSPIVSPESLYEAFSRFGKIVSCKIATDGLGLSKGYAYILFETKSAAEDAIAQMNGVMMSGRKVYVDYHVPKWERMHRIEEQKANFTNVYVKNIDYNVTEDEFRDVFARYGPITSLSLPIDGDGRCKGFGFVNYESHDDAAKAVEELNDYELRSKKLYVSRAQKKYEREEELRQQHELLRMERFSKYQGTNLYIKFLSPQVTDQDLTAKFSEFGAITSAKVITDDNGQSRGYGFVCFQNSDDAQKSIAATHEKTLWGNKLYVALALRKDYNKRGGPPAFVDNYSPWHLYSPLLRSGAPYVHPRAASQLGLSFPLPVRPAPGSVVPTPLFYAVPPTSANPQAPFVPVSSPAKFSRPAGAWQQVPFYGAQHQPNASGGYKNKSKSNGIATPSSGTSSPNPNQRSLSNGSNRVNNNRSNNNGRPSGQSSPRQPKGQESYAPSLLAAIASAANPEAEKQVVGEALYPKVLSHPLVAHDSTVAAKVTGMLLEQERNEVLKWFDDEPVLNQRIQQAYEAYCQYLERRSSEDEGGYSESFEPATKK